MRFSKTLNYAALVALVAVLAANSAATAAAEGETTAEGSRPNSMTTRSPTLRRLLQTGPDSNIGANYTLTFTGMSTEQMTRAVTSDPTTFKANIKSDMMALLRSRGVTNVTAGLPKRLVGGGGVSVEVRLWSDCGALQDVDQVMTTTQPPVNLLTSTTLSAWGMTAATVRADSDNSVERSWCANGTAKLTGVAALKLGVSLPICIMIIAVALLVWLWRKKRAAALPMVTNPSATGVPATGRAHTHQPPRKTSSIIQRPLVPAAGAPSMRVRTSLSSPTPYGGPGAPGYGQAPPQPMGYPAAASPPPGVAPYGGYGPPPPAPYSSSPVPPPGYPQQPYGGSPAPYNTGAPPPAPAYAATPGAAAPAPAGGIATGPVTFYSS
jgi:hypothetical protein